MTDILNNFDYPRFCEVDEIDPLELVGNARLTLHHHMAPAGSLDDSKLDVQVDEQYQAPEIG